VDGIAIVGMAGRFPGAATVAEFWSNLVAGTESIERSATAQPIGANGMRNMTAHGTIAGADLFDAAFFDIAPAEALLMDPQQRVFLELCWNALEDAGIDTQRFAGRVGVYAGVSNNDYRKRVEARSDLVAARGEFATMLANEKDYVATRVAHRIGLTGPAISLYTACSTSLVAVTQAWYALMTWQCDAALAGGINIIVPHDTASEAVDGGMESPDGRCRPFGADANGTVFSSGGAVVVLKRLADAIAQRDTIWAVIRGVGVNNDGADKASFTAPSVSGQATAIGLALASAGVDADSIGYVEAHGTGTALGDPIEVEALTRAFRAQSQHSQYCWLGSLKGNIGHLVAGAGVTGLIKATLALHHQSIPPSLHFRQANAEIDIGASPFKVADRNIDWPMGITPRRAGVSSFGVGGTNAHVILEQAPAAEPRLPPSRSVMVLPLSARNEQGLRDRADDLLQFLAAHVDDELADIAWSLATGRREMEFRCAIVAASVDEARKKLAQAKARAARGRASAVFFFPGQGSQHAAMAAQLVATEPVFAEAFERCCALAAPFLGCGLRDLILDTDPANAAQLDRTLYAQPALFAVEYALARLWLSWGLQPAAMVGHSLGEYVAACIAGVFSVEDAMMIVTARARAMDGCSPGAMLAVRTDPQQLTRLLGADVGIAATNAPDLTVVSGSINAIGKLEEQLESLRFASARLRVSHAFHSDLMIDALPGLRLVLGDARLHAPEIPFYSSVTGRPVTQEEAVSRDYWCRQLRAPVQFASASAHALRDAERVALEVGPGHVLSRTLRANGVPPERVVASLPSQSADASDATHLATAVGSLWSLGCRVDWDHYCASADRQRVTLPGYRFRGQRYWIDEPLAHNAAAVVEQQTSDAAKDSSPDPTPASPLRMELQDMIAGLVGSAVTAADDATPFLDLGLDSLALTQLALGLERRFGIRLKFRRLMDDLDTSAKLRGHIESHQQSARSSDHSSRADTAAPLLSHCTCASDPAPVRAGPVAQRSDADGAAFGAQARITRRTAVSPDARQRAWLDAFSARYARRTAKSKAFADRHRPAMADPRVVTGFNPLWKELVYPIVVERSHGAELWDIDGNAYVDLLNAFGANFLGYQPEVVRQALVAQIEKGFEIGPQHPLAAEVSELIREMTGVERVAFCNTGSEAVMGAMRIARTVTGRKTIVIFKDSYHGIFDEVIVRGTPQLHSVAAAPGILASAVENVLVLEFGSDAALATIQERAHELAAVMLEPVQARNPMLQPREFVRAVRGICDRGGCALIFDEVITGFRVAPGGAQEFYGVRADLVTYGKIIGGGLPLAVVAGAGKWMDALDGGAWQFGDDSQPEAGVTYFAGTFVRHPLALAAARATLTWLKQQGAQLQQTVNERTARMVARLNAYFGQCAAPMHAICFSSLWRIQVDRDQPFAELLFYALRDRGLHLYAQFNCFLSAVHDEGTIDRIVDGIRAATDELLDAGMLARTSGRGVPPTDTTEFVIAGQSHSAARVSEHTPSRQKSISADLPDEIPLTDAQAEKWLACQFGEAASVAYNESQLLMLDGALDRNALRAAIRSVGSRHEAFAMSVSADGSGFRINPGISIEPASIALRDAAELSKHCASVLRRPFDLTQAPLVRFELIELGGCRHALLLVAHHLVFDGWSAAVFFDELARTYRARTLSRDADLPVAESFRAYAIAEHRRRSGAAVKTQLDYWKRQLADAPDALGLPTDRPRAVQADFEAGTVFHDFSPELTATVRAVSRHCSVTLYATLLAAFGVLCERLSGHGDFAIGIPFAGQAVAGSDCLIGDGVNTLPVRLRVDLDETFGALVRRVHAQLLDAAENQDLTLYTLLNAIDRPQRADLGSLVDVIFNLNPRVPMLDFCGLAYELRDCAKVALVKDLFLNLVDRGDAITLDVHYRKALFDAATIARWIGHYATILVAASPDIPVRDIALLDAAQRKVLLEDYNATATACDHGQSIFALVAEKARGFSGHVAVESQGREMTFDALLQYSLAIARGLIESGVCAGDVVGVCVPRVVELPACLLGILAAGATYLPIDAANPPERLRSIVADATARHVLVEDPRQVPAVLHENCTLLEHGQIAAKGNSALAIAPVSANAPAYVIYTSGSTGTPKGVQVSHRNVVNCLAGIQERCNLQPRDVLCAITPLSFDIAGLELYLPLLVGARVLIASDRERQDPDALIALMRARGATVLQITPSWLRTLAADGRARNWPRLRILAGGEELPRSLAEEALTHCLELWNLYGPTETTIWSTACRVSHGDGPVPIGRPIANTRIYVLDAQRRLVPPGARGEIWIAGEGVTDGYLRRPELTATRFLPNPFAGAADRMYRTGDIGSWRSGELFFHGRIDNQIKLRGFRIEYGEVEAAALAQAGVSAAVASVHESASAEKRLVLYIVPQDPRAGFATELRARLRTRLPPHMVPHHIELLDKLPQTRHGKIDRKALPAPQPAKGTAQVFVARDVPGADDPLVASLLSIWRELLRIPAMDADGNFFDLGGDSLLGVELFQRAHAVTGVNLPLSSLLTAQTVRQQARAFREAGAPGAATLHDPAVTQAADPDKWSPLVSIQQGVDLPPLFCVHALGGNVLNYVPLARALGENQPVFGLQAVGLDGITPPLLTIEQMARRYLPEITSRLPHGPYYLAGGSMGGLIAFELARILVARNERVAFLGLFDTPCPPGASAQPARPGFMMRLSERVRQARRLDARGRFLMLKDALMRRIVRRCDAARSFWHRQRGTALPHDVRYRELERIHLRADAAHCAGPYRGRVTLFRASEAQGEATSRALGWEEVELGGIEIIDLPGTHDTLIEQPALALALRAALARARANENASGSAALDPSQRRRAG
jgi:amino acid adenylation domain-containing protein